MRKVEASRANEAVSRAYKANSKNMEQLFNTNKVLLGNFGD
jgi:hypothetical protein